LLMTVVVGSVTPIARILRAVGEGSGGAVVLDPDDEAEGRRIAVPVGLAIVSTPPPAR
jgi:hypothetical protein